ncbi:kynureninase [Hufsiella ginkgonis]|uniref:Kynureninase n=1 Tax=Hufsiella ginkgonis TaxID=2695274 RepID=A0A7K1Y297_9SPHI|nr:kynureninase [Hufsiella ginkgonis]MXV17361.1 kynureninase [Hufsiella ginkgonis]
MRREFSLGFARYCDSSDPLNTFRDQFLLPEHAGERATYLCGNSLGLQPGSAKAFLAEQLDAWQQKAVEGWFEGKKPWLSYHHQIRALLSPILGAQVDEISVMNSLSVNLHLAMVSFYRPSAGRYKILMEAGAFPSDQYIVASQVRFHGFDPATAVIEVSPRENEELLRTEDILKAISDHAGELALVLFSGINYYTGQFYEIGPITRAAHAAGALAGFDLAHAAGNVPLALHLWNVDFACWCSYKYLNSGPGGIAGLFVHEKHFSAPYPRFEGWWGNHIDSRFRMEKDFSPSRGAEAWQLSTSPILLLAIHQAALEIFERAGGINRLREKSIRLTGFLEFVIREVNSRAGSERFRIITPADPAARGCQLSIIARANGREAFQALAANGIIGDWREPDVIRVSPVPLYNTFEDVYRLGKCLLGMEV